MARSGRINRTRSSTGRVLRILTTSGLLLLPLGGALTILLSMEFGTWFTPQGLGEQEGGGKLIIRERPSQKLPRGPIKKTPGNFPKREELTFYHTLTDKGYKNSSRIDLQSNGAALSSKSQSIIVQLGKKGSQDTDSAEKAMHQAVPKSATAHITEKRYTLQVGSFLEKGSAQSLSQKLVGRGYSAYVIKTLIGDREVRYRVRVGHFADKIQAKAIAGRLDRQEGLKSFIAFAIDGAQ